MVGDYVKYILMDNALASWAMAIHYCNEIMAGKATLINRKYFVSSLQNAIELFIKQYMLNNCDYRVATINGILSDGEPMKSYLASDDLNSYFYILSINDKIAMDKIRSVGFNKLIEFQGKLFREYYNNNKAEKDIVNNGLKRLKKIRNNETHFYIDEFSFLSDKEFEELYNMMRVFFDILVKYHLLNIWDDADQDSRIAFKKEELKSFSYETQLKNAEFVKNLKRKIEKQSFSVGVGEDAYAISEDIKNICYKDEEVDFDELWAYVQMLLKYKILTIEEYPEENRLDGQTVYNPYRKYSISL